MPGPELGRGFAATLNFNQPAHPSCSQFLPVLIRWAGNAGKGWAFLKAGFTFVLAENLFMFNSITRQAQGLFQKSSAHELPGSAGVPPASRHALSRQFRIAEGAVAQHSFR